MPTKETTASLLKKLGKKIDSIYPKTTYIPVENAKFVELIRSDEILFIATESALDKSLDLSTLIEDTPDLLNSFATSSSRLVVYRTDGKKFYSKDAIGEVEELLGENQVLVRTHSSFIANLREIKGIQKVGNGRALVMRGSKTLVPISSRNERAIKKYLGFKRWPS